MSGRALALTPPHEEQRGTVTSCFGGVVGKRVDRIRLAIRRTECGRPTMYVLVPA
jgi:hypothetical protein